ncbi:hypothetical protein EW026_g620 [Hermanssonia centrifuga]|uniref:AB hydrolase-1 domain-containing protein n=1 Tax=Hermanssonia centrifuga TaxID=98765 RepID=A0A4S4KU92_9APHY|nr:hypothetical protein EW026_g620 [Hermanssonia centrifuga]
MKRHSILSLLIFWGVHNSWTVLAAESSTEATVKAVDPHGFPRQAASCNALNRVTNEAKEISLKYVDINPQAEKTLLMVHGWPSLWHSWKYQIEGFKNDYHLIAPDLRGFGESTHPGDVESSGTMADMVEDLVCILEHAKVAKAACVGHDWGTQVCYEAARMRPDMFDAVIGTCIPYLPNAGPFVPVEHLVPMLPKLSYNLFFERMTQEAVKELSQDVRRTLRATLRSVDSPPPDEFLQQTESFLRGWEGTETPSITFFTREEEDYWVQQFEIQGFAYTLNFYTHGNRYGSWKFANAQGNHTIPQPVLSILPTQDPVADWVLAANLLKSAEFIPNLTTETVVAAHWLQLEKPDEVNAIMRRWLDQYYPPMDTPTQASTEGSPHAYRDEL